MKSLIRTAFQLMNQNGENMYSIFSCKTTVMGSLKLVLAFVIAIAVIGKTNALHAADWMKDSISCSFSATDTNVPGFYKDFTVTYATSLDASASLQFRCLQSSFSSSSQKYSCSVSSALAGNSHRFGYATPFDFLNDGPLAKSMACAKVFLFGKVKNYEHSSGN